MNERKTVLAVVVVLTGALLLGACGGGEVAASGNIARGPASGDAAKVVARDNDFSPDEIRGTAGEEVTVEVTNRGDAVHNFVISDMEISTGNIEPGEAATATFTMPDSRVEFVCSFHGGMKGELVPEGA